MEKLKEMIRDLGRSQVENARCVVDSLKSKTYSYKDYEKRVTENEKKKKAIKKALKEKGAKGDTIVDMCRSINANDLVIAYLS